MAYDDYKLCTKKEDIPTEQHYVILKFSSVHIPGDERSRTNPGHGYPAHDQAYTEYYAYTDRDKWETAIREMTTSKYNNHNKWVAFVANPVQIKTEIVVTIDEKENNLNSKDFVNLNQNPWG